MSDCSYCHYDGRYLTNVADDMRHRASEAESALAIQTKRAEVAERQFGELSEANLQLIDQTNAALARVAKLEAALVDVMRDRPLCPHQSVPSACRWCAARAALEKGRTK